MSVHQHHYLIIGGGMAAAAAVRGIREVDAHGSIGLIGEESDLPYKRPLLSKKLWQGGSVDRIWIRLATQDLTTYLGRTVVAVNPHNKQVSDSQGTVYGYEKLLLATGGTPRRLPFGDDHITYFHTLDDYRRLRARADQGQRFGVLGGGFIAAEIAAALRMTGHEVVLVVRDDAICARLFPADLSAYVTSFYRQQGVDVVLRDEIVSLEPRGDQCALSTAGGRVLLVDGVVAGIGIRPNIALAEQAGMAVRNGIQVDQFLRTSDPDIYAAGDVAEFPDHALGEHRRVEHEDNANAMGRLAGKAMAGQAEPYHHLPFFYSDLFELGYEAVGDLDAKLQTVADWQDSYRKGVVYYLRAGRVRGVLLWNIWGQLKAARQLIAEPGPFRQQDLLGRLSQQERSVEP